MELQLVSFEQAKSLKELGFPQLENCNYYFVHDSIVDETFCTNHQSLIPMCYIKGYKLEDYYCRPTLELAAKWLRKEKKLYLNIDDALTSSRFIIFNYIDCTTEYSPLGDYEDHDCALSAAIDMAIKILNNNEKSII